MPASIILCLLCLRGSCFFSQFWFNFLHQCTEHGLVVGGIPPRIFCHHLFLLSGNCDIVQLSLQRQTPLGHMAGRDERRLEMAFKVTKGVSTTSMVFQCLINLYPHCSPTFWFQMNEWLTLIWPENIKRVLTPRALPMCHLLLWEMAASQWPRCDRLSLVGTQNKSRYTEQCLSTFSVPQSQEALVNIRHLRWDSESAESGTRVRHLHF